MKNTVRIALLVGILIVVMGGFGWYIFTKSAQNETFQKVVPQSMVLKEQIEGNVANSNSFQEEENNNAIPVPSASDEETFEKTQSVSGDTSLDMIEKELNQTDVREEIEGR